MLITANDIKNNISVKTYIEKADESLCALGYTEHSYAHATKCAETAKNILLETGHDERTAELAYIAGYIHDIGNVINRHDHAQSGAIMAFRILDNLGMPPDEIASIITAIGNHDEKTAYPVNDIAAALILADKTDVRRSRVRNIDFSRFDIHDRVNYSVYKSETFISEEKTELILSLEIDTRFCSVMEYFEIFMERMLLCHRAAEKLKLVFKLIINGQQLM